MYGIHMFITIVWSDQRVENSSSGNAENHTICEWYFLPLPEVLGKANFLGVISVYLYKITLPRKL